MENDCIVYSAKTSPKSRFKAKSICLFAIIFCIIIFCNFTSIFSFSGSLLLTTFYLGMILLPVSFIYMWQHGFEYSITEEMLCIKGTKFYKSCTEVPLNKIVTVSVHQSRRGKKFNYGTIIIATSVGKYNIVNIQDPSDFLKILKEQMHKRKLMP